ncbi:hypothetical protein DU19_0484 [Chlamydia muridarum]|nr:hypothetical protein TAC_02315 [Chlamydia muridarum str. Nigg3 CMUT3-5]AHH24244.1 hypothetical protein Y015_02315 [Chlamydia muridarum str. Nigg CM972]KDU80040.1 hypothetical protein DU17_0486 [Chlamydia muridarum]KDU81448.1 hypothetical protein DU18_0486 [Chlamydia muridarum]KDU82808.1 hypothetical protein DU19_0484 [Chlamydia muridarum]
MNQIVFYLGASALSFPILNQIFLNNFASLIVSGSTTAVDLIS